MNNTVPIPTALMDDYRRRVAVLNWLDAALRAAEWGDYEGCRAAAAEARKQLESIAAAEVRT